MLENLQADAAIKEDGDSLGGYILDSGLYPMVIDMAYFDTSKGGAMSLNLTFKGQNRENFRTSLWMTSGTAKGCNNFYVNKAGEKHYLPGFNMANAISELAINKAIGTVVPEAKTINVYNFDLRKEVPTEKDVVTELLGAEITLGLVRQTVDKNVKNAEGTYVPSGQTREENEIDKAFRTSDGLTRAEITAGATEASFKTKWADKNTGLVRNKATVVAKNTGTPGSPAGDAAPSLFA